MEARRTSAEEEASTTGTEEGTGVGEGATGEEGVEEALEEEEALAARVGEVSTREDSGEVSRVTSEAGFREAGGLGRTEEAIGVGEDSGVVSGEVKRLVKDGVRSDVNQVIVVLLQNKM